MRGILTITRHNESGYGNDPELCMIFDDVEKLDSAFQFMIYSSDFYTKEAYMDRTREIQSLCYATGSRSESPSQCTVTWGDEIEEKGSSEKFFYVTEVSVEWVWDNILPVSANITLRVQPVVLQPV